MINKFLILTLSFFTLFTFSQDNVNFCEQIQAVQTLVKTKHYAPKTLNDSTSKAVFNLFIKQLDEDKNIFMQQDIETLKTDHYQYDNYIADVNCNFITKYHTILNNRITSIKTQLETLKTQELDYSGKLTLQYIPKADHTFYKDETELNKRLRKKIAYKVIIKLLEDEKDIETITKQFTTLEPKVKLNIIDKELCLLEETLNKKGGLKRFVEESFLNALVKINDPNSTFFNNTEKIEYTNLLSKNQLSFGLLTEKNNNGEVVIQYVIPGSAAFKNGAIEKGDILKALATPQSRLEIACISQQVIQSFLNKEDHKVVTFSVQKKNGSIQDITLTKSKIQVDDNAVRGYIINADLPYGYIKIPSFYTNQESPNGRGLTADIAKELYKLQKESIQGLILDLRFNGGGSLGEAIDLSGMFIDRGPISIIKSKSAENFTLRDPKRGSFYKKPLLILVNDYSASASELFSAAMQDYNRAIIVGSKTFGKSSVQRIMPLSETKDLGYSKLTIEAFYRVTGKSHQSIGVIPDIQLPSLYDNFKSSEKDKPFALKNDSTTITFKHKALPKLKLETLIQQSKIRVDSTQEFINIKTANKKLYKLLFKEDKPYPLALKTIAKKRKERNQTLDSIFETSKKTKTNRLSISNTKSTQELLAYNAEDKNQNDKNIEAIANDAYIKEAQYILTDYINSNQ